MKISVIDNGTHFACNNHKHKILINLITFVENFYLLYSSAIISFALGIARFWNRENIHFSQMHCVFRFTVNDRRRRHRRRFRLSSRKMHAKWNCEVPYSNVIIKLLLMRIELGKNASQKRRTEDMCMQRGGKHWSTYREKLHLRKLNQTERKHWQMFFRWANGKNVARSRKKRPVTCEVSLRRTNARWSRLSTYQNDDNVAQVQRHNYLWRSWKWQKMLI